MLQQDRARRLRGGHRRDPLGQGARASWPSPPSSLDWEEHVVIDERFLRPAEVDLLVGDADQGRDRRSAGSATVDFPDLVRHDGGRRPGAGAEPAGLSAPRRWCGRGRRRPRRPARPAGGLRRRDAVVPLAVRPAARPRPTCRWCRGCRPPSSPSCGRCRCPPPSGGGPAPGPDRSGRRRAPPSPAVRRPTPWRRRRRRSAPRDPGLHRRLHRRLHHPRRLGLGASAASSSPTSACSRSFRACSSWSSAPCWWPWRPGSPCPGGSCGERRFHPRPRLGAGPRRSWAWPSPSAGPRASVRCWAASWPWPPAPVASAFGGVALLLAYSLGLGVPFLAHRPGLRPADHAAGPGAATGCAWSTWWAGRSWCVFGLLLLTGNVALVSSAHISDWLRDLHLSRLSTS